MLLQQLVNGLTLGAVYTLIALSFSLVMGILAILNLAIGELFMLGGYLGFAVIAAHLPLPAALLIAGMAGAALVALVIEKIGYQPLRDAPPITPMLSTTRLLDHLAECRHQCLGLRSAAAACRAVRPPHHARPGEHRRHAARGDRRDHRAGRGGRVSGPENRRSAARCARSPKTARSRACSAFRRAGSRCSPSCCPARSPAPPAS